jgi:putative membrane protein
MKILLNILVSTLAVLATAWVLPGIKVDGLSAALAVSVIMGIVTALLAPSLALMSLTLTPPWLALFTFVITGVLVLMTTRVVPGFHVANYWWALAFAFVLSLVNAFFHMSDAPGAKRPN